MKWLERRLKERDPNKLGTRNESSPELHGNWYGVPIVTIDDWDQLYNAAMKGDDFAVGYITFLNSKYQRPTERRTTGITRLIQGYTGVGKNRPDAMKAYKAKVVAVKCKADPASLSFTPGPPAPGAPLPPRTTIFRTHH